MADVSNIQGYNVKDKYAREQIQKIVYEELAKYLKLDGTNVYIGHDLWISNGRGKISDDTNAIALYHEEMNDNTNRRMFRINGSNMTLKRALQMNDKINGEDSTYYIHGTHNKVNASYTGNGDATPREIDTKSLGYVVVIRTSVGANGSFAIIGTNMGGIAKTGDTIQAVKPSEVKFNDGILTITSDSVLFNQTGAEYFYTVL